MRLATERVVGARRERADDDRGGLGAKRLHVQQRPVCLGLPAQDVERFQRLLGAARDEQRDPHAVEPVGDVRQHAQRCAVGPVRVVDQHRQGSLGGEVRQQPVERVAGGVGIVRGHRAGAAFDVDGEQRGRHSRRAGEQRRGVEGATAQHLVEQLADDPEPERALELGTACAEHEQVGLERNRVRGVEQRRLADARRAVDDDERSGFLRRVQERGADGFELTIALEKPVRCRRCL